MAERVKKLKEEPLLDERLPHPYREVVKELRAIRARLEEIAQKLSIAPALPAVPIVKVLPTALVTQLTTKQYMDTLVEAFEKEGILKFADDLYVETIDLSKDRSTDATIEEFPKLKGIALTIFRTTGSFDLYINQKDDTHKLNFDALTYPQTFLLDWFLVKRIYIGNSAQSGKEAKLIAWKRLS